MPFTILDILTLKVWRWRVWGFFWRDAILLILGSKLSHFLQEMTLLVSILRFLYGPPLPVRIASYL